jgi:hypothetical protein
MKKVLIYLGVLLVLVSGYFIINSDKNIGSVIDGRETLVLQASSTTTGSNYFTQGVKTISCSIANNGFTGVIKFVGSNQYDFSSTGFATSSTYLNRWDYIESVDTQDGSSIDGDTGFTFSSSSDVRQFELNVNDFRYISAVATSYTGGTAYVYCKQTNIQ